METKEKNRRKMLLALPVLVIPFLALAFHGLDGGKETTVEQKPVDRMNTSLPDAQFKKEDPRDKLSLYRLAAKDSSTRRDPLSGSEYSEKLSSLVMPPPSQVDPDEKEINEKLALIQKEITHPVREAPDPKKATSAGTPNPISKDVDRLEKLMYAIQENKEEDPEMEQLSQMLDKIIQIQNPESLAAKTEAPVKAIPDSQFRAIPAEIARKQKAVHGSTVELRLLDTVTLGGYLIPKGHRLFGTCRIANQRLLLDIVNIRLGTSIVPVSLTVYSLDGMPGVNAPEAILTDATRMGTDNAVRNIGLYGMDQSVATQVAGAGIDAARDLISKKVRKIKVKLNAGEHVLLRNNSVSRH